MTRGRPMRIDGKADAARDPLILALDEYQARFGNSVTFAGIAAARGGEVTALLREAIRNGQPTSDRIIRLALGVDALPSEVDARTDPTRSPLAEAIGSYRGRFGDTPWASTKPQRKEAKWRAVIRRATRIGTPRTNDDPIPREDYEALIWAVGLYRARFGIGPAVQQFLRWPTSLTREILAAEERGERLTAEGLHGRLEMTPPPAAVAT